MKIDLKIRYFVVCLGICVFTLNTFSNNQLLQFEKLTIEDGLSHNSVNCFLHDSKGFLWIGTFEGLNRYNGYDIEIFRSNINDPASLSNNFIECIAEDSRGYIWIGTQNGLNRYCPETKQFKQYLPDWSTPNSLNHNIVKDILKDKHGNLWIAFYGGGIARYDYDNDNFIQYCESDKPGALKSSFINDLFEDHVGNIWLATWKQGLIKFNPRTEEFSQYLYEDDKDNFEKYNTIASIHEGNQGTLLLGTWQKGIITFNIKNNKFGHLPFKDQPDLKFNETVVTSILSISTKKLLVSTYKNGVFIINIKNPVEYKVEHYVHDFGDPRSLSDNSVWKAYIDRSGICWIGTWGGGVNKLDFDKNRFQTYRSLAHDNSWLHHYMISSIVEDSKGYQYISTIDGGFYKFDKRNSSFTDLNQYCGNIIKCGINSMAIDNDDCIWIGSQKGLFCYNIKNNTLKEFTRRSATEQLTGNDFSTIYVDYNNNIWAGTWNTGLNRFIPDKDHPGKYIHKTYWHVENDSTTISSNTVSCIFQDHFGTIWMGTSGGGLNIFQEETNCFKRFKVYDEKNQCIINYIACIYEDSKGELWAGSFSQGLCRVNRKNGNVINYNTKNSNISNSGIYSIIEDTDHNLWLGTGYGISCYNRSQNSFRNYFKKDGLHGNTFNVNIVGPHLKCKDGYFIFGGVNGFTIFNPSEISKSTFIPNVILTKLSINGNEVLFGDTINRFTILNNPLYQQKEIKLTHKNQVIGFEFAAMHFATPENNKYAYMLEGIDHDWIYTNADQRVANYSNLPTGSYTFKVKASNSDGVWNNQSITSLIIDVKPPFWKTFWLYSLIILIIFSIAYLFFRSQIKLKNFQMSVQSKLHEAEQIISEKQIIKLKNEKLDVELESKNKELASKALYLNQKNERLKVIKDYLNEIIPNTSEKVGKSLNELQKIIDGDISNEENWDKFEKNFDVLYNDFMKRFTSEFPNVTHKDLKIIGYIRQNYYNKEIAEMLNISLRSLESSRYRLRKKMNLASEINLNDFIIRY